MSLRDDIPMIIDRHKSLMPYLGHNYKLFDIFEGNLLPYILSDLKKQLSAKSFEQAEHRVPPINMLRKIVDKLSKIYADPPKRMVVGGSDTDSELLRWYESNFNINQKMNQSNEFFNLFKNSLVQPYLDMTGKPGLRVIPSDRFFVLSKDPFDMTRPTHVVLIMGKKSETTGEVWHYAAWTDYEVLIFNSKGEINNGEMARIGNLDGINEFGAVPFVYVNRSLNQIMPTQDTDTLCMTKLIPIVLTDLSYSIMFQAFSIIYGIDIDDENLVMSPSSFWKFKSDPSTDKEPQIGTLKPSVDIQAVILYIQSTLGMWLNSRGIRPGQIGELSGDQFASGISKMIDEMDAVEDKRVQITFFKPAEENLWDLVLKKMHPVWSSRGMIENQVQFTPSADIDVVFSEMKPMASRGQIVIDLRSEMDGGFISRRDAMKRLNPDYTDAEIDEMIEKINAENISTRESPDGKTAENQD